MSLSDLARELNRTAGSLRGRITQLRLSKKVHWTDAEEEALVALYRSAGADGVLGLAVFAESIGRHPANVVRKARSLGLVPNPHRKIVDQRKNRNKHATIEDARAAVGRAAKERLAANGHPRGALGLRHSVETRRKISAASRAGKAALTIEEKSEIVMKAMRTRIKNHGCIAPRVSRGSWKAGWREIGGKRNYYRSRWEANYGRYLEWLKSLGEIADWQHEPETFWFEAIKRGVRSYKPDFRVWENNGTSGLHEVKGWMDARSKTTLRRMAKYHPHEKITVIDGRQYRAIRMKVIGLIPDWEDASRDGYA